jgi:hypothetical protein
MDTSTASWGEWIYFWTVLVLAGGIVGACLVARRRSRNRFTGRPRPLKRRRARGPLKSHGP